MVAVIEVVTAVVGAMLGIAALMAGIRLAIGPSIADRMVALDSLLYLGAGAIALRIVVTRDGTLTPVLVVMVLVGFVGTVVVSRFIERDDR